MSEVSKQFSTTDSSPEVVSLPAKKACQRKRSS